MDGKLGSTAVIIRSFTNPFVEKQVSFMLKIGVGTVVVVTDAVRDKGATAGYLSKQLSDPRVQLIEMEGYTWSHGLNRGLISIQIDNAVRRATGNSEFRFLFDVSVEAGFTKEHLETMLDEMTDDPKYAVIGTSFEGRQNGNVISLGRSYRHPRNTGMLIRLETMGMLMGGFDPRCDSIGGMEDIDFVLRMLATSDFKYKMLDLQVTLVVGTNYHQPTKEQNEQKAMDLIIDFWRSLFPKRSEQRARIDEAIKKMGIEKTFFVPDHNLFKKGDKVVLDDQSDLKFEDQGIWVLEEDLSPEEASVNAKNHMGFVKKINILHACKVK